MLVTQITTHAADAQARLLSQFANRPIFNSLIAILAGQIQGLENALFPLDLGQQINGAYGAQLDQIGNLVGLARNGLTDAQYQVLIRGTIAQNSSNCTNETLVTIATNCFQATSACVRSAFSPGYSHRLAPASIAIEVGTPTIDVALYPLVINILKNSIAATTTLSWVSIYDATQAFTLAGGNNGLGLADANVANSGGMLANLIYNNLAN